MKRFGGRLARLLAPSTMSSGSDSGYRALEAPPRDLDAARRGYQRAADAGNRDAMCDLGFLYLEWMEPPDLDAARRWYERAADAGSSDAMVGLGALAAQWMEPPDLDVARRWFERAADAGNSLAIYLHLNGAGQPDRKALASHQCPDLRAGARPVETLVPQFSDWLNLGHQSELPQRRPAVHHSRVVTLDQRRQYARSIFSRGAARDAGIGNDLGTGHGEHSDPGPRRRPDQESHHCQRPDRRVFHHAGSFRSSFRQIRPTMQSRQ